ncbi:ATP-binding protein [Lysinimonas soli]|uniref:histidine kinase n=1 Tax=Lysinimonas soli TaxID=1074233 RepID=A0ABW0NPX9_9MICO
MGGMALDLAPSRRRIGFRARLTLTYALLLATMGALMLGAVYVFMRFVPTYAIVSSDAGSTGATPTSVGSSGVTSPSASGTMSLNLETSADILNTLLLVSVIVLLLLTAAGGLIGWVIAGRMLRPLKTINRAAQLAASGELGHRLRLGGPQDEMRDLAETFDDMLAKLDLAFQAHQRFAANASHELRTPLATTKAMLDIALSDPDLDLAGLRRVSQQVLETNRRNIETVESLLDLADIGQSQIGHERIRLDRAALDAIGEAAAEISERGLTISSNLEPVEFYGDAVLVHRALVNLVHNAVRHNVQPGTVDVTVRSASGWAEFRISNTGPHVDASVADSLREPFVRGAGRVASGSRERSGHGLGLALVASVAGAHHGELELSANEGGGMTVAIRLPINSGSMPISIGASK